MISRKTLAIDRAATLLLAALLVAGGATAVWWWSGRPVRGVTLPDVSDTAAAREIVGAAGPAWAVAAVGVLLAVVGIRWAAAHLVTGRVGQLHLAGSGESGRLQVEAGKVASAAADALADSIGVRSANGSVVRDRGQLVAALHATIEPDADLALVARRADEVSAQLAGVLGRDDLHCTVHLRVAPRGRALPRAR